MILVDFAIRRYNTASVSSKSYQQKAILYVPLCIESLQFFLVSALYLMLSLYLSVNAVSETPLMVM